MIRQRAQAEAVPPGGPIPVSTHAGARGAHENNPAKAVRLPLARGVAAVRDGGHVTGQLPSLAGQQQRVHDAAAQWEHSLLRRGRLAWGYFHLVVIKLPLNVIEWATEAPARFLVTAVLVLLALKFL